MTHRSIEPRRSAIRGSPAPMRSLARKLIRRVSTRYGPRPLIGLGLMHLIYAWKRIFMRDYVVVSPTVPRSLYSLWKLARLAGIRIVAEHRAPADSAARCLARIRHDDDTWDEPHPGLVNGLCTDISKSHVDAMFGQAFGYATRMDPTTFHGRAVMKPERNYSGGGIFVDCPLDPSEILADHIYQQLVDNETSPGVVTEYRVSVICGEITDVITQYRSVGNRLTGRGSGGGRGSIIGKATDVFSTADIDRILKFCALMNLDFGELDVLPDVADGRLYILDANKTPSYMVRYSAFRTDRFLLAYRRAQAFRRLLQTRWEAGSPISSDAYSGGEFLQPRLEVAE